MQRPLETREEIPFDRDVDSMGSYVYCRGTVVVFEPNGYNPVLKLIERTSCYHREHGERPYPPVRPDNWLRHAGLTIARRGFFGPVPYFCQDGTAHLLNRREPLAERASSTRALACGTYVSVGTRPDGRAARC